jgi:hypothetical protein
MNTHSQNLMNVTKGTVVALAGLMIASCASTRSSSPEQVAASNPTVTYEYRNDDELIQANQRAITFCNQYQALPRAQSFDNDEEHHNHRVIFECVGASTFASAPLRQSNSDLTYNFRTDQELLDVSRDAQVYCLNSGAPEMDSNIVIHSNGSKTVTFRCSQG